MVQGVVVSALTYGRTRTDHNSYPCIPTPGVPTTCLVGVLYPYSDFFRFVGTFHIHACTLPLVSILTSKAMGEAMGHAISQGHLVLGLMRAAEAWLGHHFARCLTSEATISEATISEATTSEATTSEATISEATTSEATRCN